MLTQKERKGTKNAHPNEDKLPSGCSPNPAFNPGLWEIMFHERKKKTVA